MRACEAIFVWGVRSMIRGSRREPRGSMGRCATPLMAVGLHFLGGFGQPQ